MRQITFNPQNWVKDQETLTVTEQTPERACFTLYDYHFTLTRNPDVPEDIVGFALWRITSPSWKEPLGSVCDDRPYPVADDGVILAAARYLANRI